MLHAPRQGAGKTARERSEARKRKQALEARLPLRAGNAAQISVKRQVLKDRKIVIKAKALRHIANDFPKQWGLRDRIEFANLKLAGVRLQKSQHQAQ